MDVDGVTVSAPLMQPSQSTFASFGGRFQVSGNFTRNSARQLAAVLASGPLPAALSG
jgi:preprotein translocase subunit SecD